MGDKKQKTEKEKKADSIRKVIWTFLIIMTIITILLSFWYCSALTVDGVGNAISSGFDQMSNSS